MLLLEVMLGLQGHIHSLLPDGIIVFLQLCNQLFILFQFLLERANLVLFDLHVKLVLLFLFFELLLLVIQLRSQVRHVFRGAGHSRVVLLRCSLPFDSCISQVSEHLLFPRKVILKLLDSLRLSSYVGLQLSVVPLELVVILLQLLLNALLLTLRAYLFLNLVIVFLHLLDLLDELFVFLL